LLYVWEAIDEAFSKRWIEMKTQRLNNDKNISQRRTKSTQDHSGIVIDYDDSLPQNRHSRAKVYFSVNLALEIRRSDHVENYYIRSKATLGIKEADCIRFFKNLADQIVFEYDDGGMSIWPDPEEQSRFHCSEPEARRIKLLRCEVSR
jgi:hypothetical protein